jgi:RNA polymerase II-associated factor 1
MDKGKGAAARSVRAAPARARTAPSAARRPPPPAAAALSNSPLKLTAAHSRDSTQLTQVPLRFNPEGNPLKAEGRFMVSFRFGLELPPAPGDAKLLLPPLDAAALGAFRLTDIEAAPALAAAGLAPPLGAALAPALIRRLDAPLAAARPPLHPDDAALLGADAGAALDAPRGGGGAGAPGARRPDAEATWLMRTKYITNEASGARAAAAAGAGARAAAGALGAAGSQDALGGGAAQPQSREAQLAAIEASFAAAAAPPVHARDPTLRPVEVLPLFPDDDLAARGLVLAAFDGDPLADAAPLAGASAGVRARAAAAAQLKSFVRRRADGGADRFVALMLPRPPAPLLAAADGAPDGALEGGVPPEALAGEYAWVREYESAVRYDASGQTFLLRLGSGAAGYADLNTRVALRKRKRGAGGGAGGGEEEEDGGFLQPEHFVLALPEEGDAPAAAAEEKAEEKAEAAAPEAAAPAEEEAVAPASEPQEEGGEEPAAMDAEGGGAEEAAPPPGDSE